MHRPYTLVPAFFRRSQTSGVRYGSPRQCSTCSCRSLDGNALPRPVSECVMVTVQSVTSHPWSPWRSVSFTVSSTAVKKRPASSVQIDFPLKTLRRYRPGPARRAARRLSRNGLGLLVDDRTPRRCRWAVRCRSCRLAECDVEAELVARVAWMTSFCTSRRAREISRASIVCRRLMNGSCSANWVSATCSAPLSAVRRGTTTVSSVGGEKWWPSEGVVPGYLSGRRSARRRAPRVFQSAPR